MYFMDLKLIAPLKRLNLCRFRFFVVILRKLHKNYTPQNGVLYHDSVANLSLLTVVKAF